MNNVAKDLVNGNPSENAMGEVELERQRNKNQKKEQILVR